MSRTEDLDLRYLQVLVTINGSLRHALRSQIGSVKIQADLIREIMALRQPGDPEAWEKVRHCAAVAQKSCEKLVEMVEHALSGTRRAGDSQTPLDLRQLIREMGGLLRPFLLDRGVGLEVQIPDHPVTLDGSRDVIHRGLLVLLVEASLTLGASETLELRLDVDGVLHIGGAPADQWLPGVADIVEAMGGSLESGPHSSTVAMRLPIQTRT